MTHLNRDLPELAEFINHEIPDRYSHNEDTKQTVQQLPKMSISSDDDYCLTLQDSTYVITYIYLFGS